MIKKGGSMSDLHKRLSWEEWKQYANLHFHKFHEEDVVEAGFKVNESYINFLESRIKELEKSYYDSINLVVRAEARAVKAEGRLQLTLNRFYILREALQYYTNPDDYSDRGLGVMLRPEVAIIALERAGELK
jgi:hypothetical protein